MKNQNRKHSYGVMGVFLTVAFIFSCLTINVYFPAAAVEEAANKFVQDVQESNADKAAEKTGKEQSWFRFQLISEAHAQGEDAIKIDTPLASQIKASMKERYADLSSFKSKGAVGEGKDGFLAIKDLNALSLPERGKAQKLVQQANADRKKLYQEIVRANGYPPEKLEEVQEIFAKSWISNSKEGWYVQDSSGSWKKK